MNSMILGRGFAVGVVIPVMTLVTSILSKIPVFTITGKRKDVSGMVTVVPVCLTGAMFFIACSCLGFELLKDALARMVLVLLGGPGWRLLYCFMSHFISAIIKLAIKEVVIYTDEKIKVTKQLTAARKDTKAGILNQLFTYEEVIEYDTLMVAEESLYNK